MILFVNKKHEKFISGTVVLFILILFVSCRTDRKHTVQSNNELNNSKFLNVQNKTKSFLKKRLNLYLAVYSHLKKNVWTDTLLALGAERKFLNAKFKVTVLGRKGDCEGYYFLGVTPDKKKIVEVTQEGVVKIWDVKTANLIKKFFLNTDIGGFASMKIIRKGKILLMASYLGGSLLMWDLNTGEFLKEFSGHAFEFVGLEITPDEKYAVTWGSRKVKIWEIATGKFVKQFDGYEKARVFSNNKLILWGKKDKEIDIVELITGKLLTKINTKLSVIAFLKTVPESNKIILVQNRKIEVWDINGKKLLYDKNEENLISGMFDLSEIQDIAVTPDGKNLILLFNYVIKVFDLVNGNLLKTINLGFDNNSFFFSIVQVINANTLVLQDVSDILKILVIDLNKGKIVKEISEKNAFPTRNFFSSEVCSLSNNKFAIMNDYSLRIYDIEKNELTLLDGTKDIVYFVAFSRTGKRVVMLTEDYLNSISNNEDEYLGKFTYIAKVWDFEKGKVIKSLKCENVSSVSITPDGQKIIMGYLNGALAKFDLKDNKFIRIKNAQNSAIKCVAVTEDGQKIVSGDEKGNIKIWSLNNLKLIKKIEGTNSEILCLDITANEEKLLAGDRSGVISIWNLNSGKLIKKLKADESIVNCLAITPDGKRIVSGTNESNVHIWDMKKGILLKTLKFEGEGSMSIKGISITSDGKNAIIAVDRWFEKVNDFVVCDLNSYKQKICATFNNPGYCSINVKVIPGENKFIASCGDGTVRIINSKDGTVLYNYVSFLDGEWVAVSNKGYYSCSPDGEKYLFIKINNEIYDISLFHEVLCKNKLSINL